VQDTGPTDFILIVKKHDASGLMAQCRDPGDHADGELRERPEQPRREQHGEGGHGQQFRRERQTLFLQRRDGLKQAHEQADHEHRQEKRRDHPESEDDRVLENIDGDFGIHGRFSVQKTLHERLHDQMPAIHEDEEQEFKGQRHDIGRHHHHAEGHQHRTDEEIDDEKREEQQKPHLKSRLEFADHKGRDHDADGQILHGRGAEAAELEKIFQVACAGLLQHEFLERRGGLVEGVGGLQLAIEIRPERLLVYAIKGGTHDEKSQEERQAGENHVRRRGGHAERGADKAQHDDDAREARHHQDQRRRDRQQSHQQDNLHGDAQLHGFLASFQIDREPHRIAGRLGGSGRSRTIGEGGECGRWSRGGLTKNHGRPEDAGEQETAEDAKSFHGVRGGLGPSRGESRSMRPGQTPRRNLRPS